MAFWSTKAPTSLKHDKDRGKVTMEGLYRNSPTLFRKVVSPTPCGLLFPKIVGSQPPPKTPIAIIPGTGKATNFKFGWNIHRVYSNKSPLKSFDKRQRGRFRGLSKVFKYPRAPILSQERVKLYTDFKFCTHFHRIDYNKSPSTISGKVAMGVARDS